MTAASEAAAVCEGIIYLSICLLQGGICGEGKKQNIGIEGLYLVADVQSATFEESKLSIYVVER